MTNALPLLQPSGVKPGSVLFPSPLSRRFAMSYGETHETVAAPEAWNHMSHAFAVLAARVVKILISETRDEAN